MRLEPGQIYDGGAPHAAQVLMLTGVASLLRGARVRWKLSRDEA
jgi:hypothetical protein